MRSRFAVFLLTLFVGLSLAARAQAPAAPAIPAALPAASPTLDGEERAWLQILTLSEQLAYSECQRLESVGKFNATVADVVKRIEERHPGYTLDRRTGTLVVKAAQ